MVNFESVRNIAYLEPPNSFSEMAKDEFCRMHKLNCFTTPLTTIKQIVDYVAQNPDTVGVLPVENTLDGTIRESLDYLITSKNPNIRIISEIVLPIEYCLLSKTTEFYSITGLIATPRLIGKCQEFIQNELPRNLNIIETPTMLEAANELRNHNLTYASIGNNLIFRVPINTWIMLALFAITTVILRYTRMGKHIYALGGSESTIKTEGIDPARVKIFAFSICGLFSAIAGILLSAQMATVHPTQGAAYQLDAVAASLIGGVSMLGGEGQAWMSVVGALIIGFLRNALDMLAIDPFYQNLVIGAAIIIVVGISVYNRNKELKSAKVF